MSGTIGLVMIQLFAARKFEDLRSPDIALGRGLFNTSPQDAQHVPA